MVYREHCYRSFRLLCLNMGSMGFSFSLLKSLILNFAILHFLNPSASINFFSVDWALLDSQMSFLVILQMKLNDCFDSFSEHVDWEALVG